MSKIIVADIDGCCLDPTKRLHHIKAEDWESYHDAWQLDTVIPQGSLIYRVLNSLPHYRLLFVTAREERAREYTLHQLQKHVSTGIMNSQLLMRPNDDYDTRGGTPDYVLKPQLIRAAGYTYDDIFMVFEDRQTMVDEWRRLGCVVYQTAARLD